MGTAVTERILCEKHRCQLELACNPCLVEGRKPLADAAWRVQTMRTELKTLRACVNTFAKADKPVDAEWLLKFIDVILKDRPRGLTDIILVNDTPKEDPT
jgi:hypothetical protein